MGEDDVPGDDEGSEALQALDDLLCLVIRHAVDSEGVHPCLGVVLPGEH